MAFFRNSEPRPATNKIENVIGPSATFNGTIKAEGGIRIDGLFEGAVESQSNIIIGENARVVADVSAFNITVAGSVEGNVKAIGRLEILSTGHVQGDVQAGSFLIEEGGVFHGQSLMDTDPQAVSQEKQGEPEPDNQRSEDRRERKTKQRRGSVSQEAAATAEK